jgi:dTDP-4-amino-4,6-dideoxygalactose transaminase
MTNTRELAVNGGSRVVPERAHRTWPELLHEDREAVLRVLDRVVLAGANAPEITAFQKEYAAYLGVDYCLAVNSGTAALHCAAAAVGLQPGDEVIVPAYTFIASAYGMAHQGAVPAFCDVDPRTYNLDPAKIEERITDRTRAILAVHIHGLPADMDGILGVGARRGLPVIEDAAQAHGVRYHGRRTGTIGACSAASLNVSKNLSAGEGGVFATNDPDAFAAARRLSVFGEDLVPLDVRSFWSHGLGWNYRNQELSCALARTQLRRLDGFNETAERNGARLTTGLSDVPGMAPPYVPDDCGCVYWKYMVQLDPDELGFDGPASELRDRVLVALQAEGVDAMVWQPQPVPAQPAFRRALRPWHARVDQEPLREWDPGEFPVASRLVDCSLSLVSERHPLFVQDEELVDLYVEAVHKVFANLDAVLSMPFTPIKRVRELVAQR